VFTFGSGFRVQGSGFEVRGSGFDVSNVRVLDLRTPNRAHRTSNRT